MKPAPRSPLHLLAAPVFFIAAGVLHAQATWQPVTPGTGTGNFTCVELIPDASGEFSGRVFVSGDIGGLHMGRGTGNAFEWAPAGRGLHTRAVRQIVQSETNRTYALGEPLLAPQYGTLDRRISVYRAGADQLGPEWVVMPIDKFDKFLNEGEPNAVGYGGATVITRLGVGNDPDAANPSIGNDFLLAVGPNRRAANWYSTSFQATLSGQSSPTTVQVTEVATMTPAYHPLQLMVYAAEAWHAWQVAMPLEDFQLAGDGDPDKHYEQRFGVGSLWLDRAGADDPAGDPGEKTGYRFHLTAVVETWSGETRLAKRSALLAGELRLDPLTFVDLGPILLSETAALVPEAIPLLAEIETRYPPAFQTSPSSPKSALTKFHPLVVTGDRQGGEVTFIVTVGPMMSYELDTAGDAHMPYPAKDDPTRVAISATTDGAAPKAGDWTEEFALEEPVWSGHFFHVGSARGDAYAGVYHREAGGEWGGLWRRVAKAGEEGFEWKRATRLVGDYEGNDVILVQIVDGTSTEAVPADLTVPDIRTVAVGYRLNQAFDGFKDEYGYPIVWPGLKDLNSSLEAKTGVPIAVRMDNEGKGGAAKDGLMWRRLAVDFAPAWKSLRDQGVDLATADVRQFLRLSTRAATGKAYVRVHTGQGLNADCGSQWDFRALATSYASPAVTQPGYQVTPYPGGGVEWTISLDGTVADPSALHPANMNRERHWRSRNAVAMGVERLSVVPKADGSTKVMFGLASARGLFASRGDGGSFHPLGVNQSGGGSLHSTRGIDLMRVQRYHLVNEVGSEHLYMLMDDGGPAVSTDGGHQFQYLGDRMSYQSPALVPGLTATDVYAITDRRLASGQTEVFIAALSYHEGVAAGTMLSSTNGGAAWEANRYCGLSDTSEVWSMATVRPTRGVGVAYAAAKGEGVYYLDPLTDQWTATGAFVDGTGATVSAPRITSLATVDGEPMLLAAVSPTDTQPFKSVQTIPDGPDSATRQAQAGLYLLYVDPVAGVPLPVASGFAEWQQIAGVRAQNSDFKQAFRFISDVDLVRTPALEGSLRVAISAIPPRGGGKLVEGGVYVTDSIPSFASGLGPPPAVGPVHFERLSDHPFAAGVALDKKGNVHCALGTFSRYPGGGDLVLATTSSTQEDLLDLVPSSTTYDEEYLEGNGYPQPGYEAGVYRYAEVGGSFAPKGDVTGVLRDVVMHPAFLDVIESSQMPTHLYLGLAGAGGYRVPLSQL